MHLPTSKLDVPQSHSDIASPISILSLANIAISVTGDDGDSRLQRWSSFIGIVTAICGNILISFALNVQRYAHIRLHRARIEQREKLKALARKSKNGYGAINIQDSTGSEGDDPEALEDDPLRESFLTSDSRHSALSDDDDQSVSSYLKSPYWWTGIILMTLGEAGNFLAYGFAPASIVSPLGVVALVSNCVIAPIMLKEKFRLRDFWGVLVAIAGAVTVVLSAKNEEKKLGPHEIWGAITTIEFKVYLVVTLILIGILLWASPRYGNRTILIDLGLVGLFGGYTALSTKGISSMLSYTFWRVLTTPITYVLVTVLVGTAILQIRYVNKALQQFDSTQVIPVQFVLFTLCVIIGSAVLYRDFEKTTAESVAKFVSGCLLTFFGVFLITNGRPPVDDDESELSEEDNEAILQDTTQELTEEERQNVNGAHGAAINGGKARSDTDLFLTTATEADTNLTLESPSYVSDDPSPVPSTPRIQLPSDDAAGGELTPLLNNPWNTAVGDGVEAGQGADALRTLPRSVIAAAHTRSTDSLGFVRTSPLSHGHHNRSPQPSSSVPHIERPVTPVKHSKSIMMPGPLLSPLSGGLSVVVADTLRRGVDGEGRKSVRKSRLGLRRATSGEQELSRERIDASQAEQQTSDAASTPLTQNARSRAASLSHALTGLFRTITQRSESADNHRPEEAGPSGP